MSNFNYPLGDHELRHDNPVTTDFEDGTYNQFDFTKFNFEFDAPDVTFVPKYYPERVVVAKERDLAREKGICRNEYVKDVGTENREIHVVGLVSAYEDSDLSSNNENYINNLQSFHNLADFGQRGMLLTMQWQGEVVVHDTEIEGPVGIDPETGHFMYEYTIDFVSTGLDEMGASTTGILNDGENNIQGSTPEGASGGFLI